MNNRKGSIIIALFFTALAIFGGCARKESSSSAVPSPPAKETGPPPSAGKEAPVADSTKAPAPASAPSVTGGIGIPVYPGVKVKALDKTETEQMKRMPGMRVVKYTTTDKFEKVAAWYKANFKDAKSQSDIQGKIKRAMYLKIDKKANIGRIAQLATLGKDVDITLVQSPVMKQKQGLPDEGSQDMQPPPNISIDKDKSHAANTIGIPLYPGSSIARGAVITDKKSPGASQTMVALSTQAKPAEVIAWYKDQIKGSKVQDNTMGNTKVTTLSAIDSATNTRRQVQAVVGPDGKTIVMLGKLVVPKGLVKK